MKNALLITKIISITLIIYFAFKAEELNVVENYIKNFNLVVLSVIIIIGLRSYFKNKKKVIETI